MSKTTKNVAYKPGTWRPGTSGNPIGRPHKLDSITAILRSRMPAEDRAEQLMWLATSAEDERVRLAALIEIVNRTDGPITKKLDATVNSAKPVYDVSRLPLAKQRELLEQLRAIRIAAETTDDERAPVLVSGDDDET